MPKRMLIGILLIGLLLVLAIFFWTSHKPADLSGRPLQKVTIAAIPHSFTGYSIFIAFEKGYFKQQGLDVVLKPSYPHGKAILNAVIKGDVEMGATSETPFVHAVLGGGKLFAFITTVTAKNHLAIVARKDRGIVTPQDLKGKTIGVTLGTNGEYFMDLVLLMNGVLRKEVNPVHLKPGQMVDSLVNGKVDAIATWNPPKYQAQKKLGNRASVFSAGGIYSPYFIVSATKRYVHENPVVIEKVVRSLQSASSLIRANRKKSHQIVAPYMKIEETLLDRLSATYQFDISLEQSLLLTMESQSKWAIKNGLTDSTDIPNYLDFIYTDALEKVEPENMTIIK